MGQEAWAEGPSGERTAAGAEANVVEQALRRGERARRAGRWAEAEAAYRAALSALPRPAIAGELGLCELALGKHRDAAEHLQQGLAGASSLTPQQRRRFEEGQGKAELEVAALEIAVSQPRAEVFLDGKRLGQGRAYWTVYVEPGPHEVRGVLEGYVGEAARFDAIRGGRPIVPLQLDPLPKSPLRMPPAVVPATPPPPPPDGTGRTVRIWGVALASAGVALGTGFAIASAVKANEEEVNAETARGAAQCSSHRAVAL
jgi:tetratricopeptide (TPR) repeat protein